MTNTCNEITTAQQTAAKAARLAIYTPAMLKRIADQHAGGHALSDIEAELGIEMRLELAAMLNAR